MGTLTFQATAGGSVNLLGPNISGTVNLTLPSADGTSGQPLQTNGSGTLSFATLGIGGGGTGLTSFTANQIHYGSFSQSAGLTFDGTNFATTGTATAAKLIPTGTSVTGNGMYLPATNALGFSTNGTNAVYIDASQNVGIGTSSPAGKLVAVGQSAFGKAAPSSFIAASEAVTVFGVAATEVSQRFWQAGVASALMGFKASDSAFYISNTYAGNALGTSGIAIDSSGNVLVTSAAGLGYGTGSGGTVTQATSKSTTVTLNKPTGQITMNAAALAGLTSVGFTFNNSLIANTDVLIVSISNATAANSYTTVVNWTGAGQAVIQLTNTTASILSDAVKINFAIIKGATS